MAVYWRIALIALGGSGGFDGAAASRLPWITPATTPLVTAAAMLVPLSVM
jgi:hypothetical protein